MEAARSLVEVLEAERELVLATQQNYRQLKQAFLQLREEHAEALRVNEQLRTRNANSERLRRNFAQLETQSRDLIRQLEEDGEERRLRNELFKTSTLAELQHVFQQEQKEAEERYSNLQKERNALAAEKSRLQNSVELMKDQMKEVSKKSREREIRLREHIDTGLEKVAARLDDSRVFNSEDVEHLQQYRKDVECLEVKLHEAKEAFRLERSEFELQLQNTRSLLEDEKILKQIQATECKELQNTVAISKELLTKKNEEIAALQKRLVSLAVLEHNTCAKDFEQIRAQGILLDQDTVEKQFKILENEVVSRNETIESLRAELRRLQSERDQLRQKQSATEDLRTELAQLELSMKDSRKECEQETKQLRAQIDELLRRRAQLEELVASYRQKLHRSPEAEEEIARLKEAVTQRDTALKQGRNAAAHIFAMTKAVEDTWAFQPIGAPFPDSPVKVWWSSSAGNARLTQVGHEQNMYVALWYKHGKPIHGRSWNNGGVVECSFPYKEFELTGTKDLGGQIQVLQYKGDHNKLGYWYNWIKYSERLDKEPAEREIVRCGDSIPIYWTDSPDGPVLGYVDNKTEVAWFSINKKVVTRKGGELNNMQIIVRELKGAPPGCDCKTCMPPGEPPKPLPPIIRVMLNEWADLRAGDPWPTKKLVQALGKSLDTLPGENPDQYVALWYQAGEPVMGRIWNDGGKIAANFSWGGHEYNKNIGSLQVLFELNEAVRGFDYGWIPFPEAAKFADKEWFPVHVNHHKGDISPGVISVNGKQILGKVDIKNERASYGGGGKENVITGPPVHSTIVLCRKPKPGCKFD